MKSKILTAISVTLLTFALVQSAVAQDTQYGRGLLLDYYVIQNPEDVEEPAGRSMATLVDTSAPSLSYYGPFEIEPSLVQFQDQFWGLLWSGYLKIEAPGPHSFNLMLNTSNRGANNSEKISCRTFLKVGGRVIAEHGLTKFGQGPHNAYGELELDPGLYQIETWLACNEAGFNTSISQADPKVTINMRGPNDAMLKPIPKNQLLHEL